LFLYAVQITGIYEDRVFVFEVCQCESYVRHFHFSFCILAMNGVLFSCLVCLTANCLFASDFLYLRNALMFMKTIYCGPHQQC
jgi:hypothetical protein